MLYPNKHSYNSSVYDGGLYYLKNEKSDKYLDLDHGRTESGTNILGWQYNGNDNQKFYFYYLGMELYEIVPYCTSESILHSVNANEGANIEIKPKDRTVNQKFKLHMIAYDKAIIYTQASNFTKALYYNSSDKKIIQKDYNSLSSENKEYAHWTFNEIDSFYYNSYKKFYIKNARTGLYLDAVNKGINNSTSVQARPFTGEENQQWKRLYDNSSNCYYFKPMHRTDMALDGVKLYSRLINGIPTDDYYLEFYNDNILTGIYKSSYTLPDNLVVPSLAGIVQTNAEVLTNSDGYKKTNYSYTNINGELRLIEKRGNYITVGELTYFDYIFFDVATGEMINI